MRLGCRESENVEVFVRDFAEEGVGLSRRKGLSIGLLGIPILRENAE